MTFLDLTKSTSAGAGLTHEKKRRSSLGIALAAIWTAPFFTNGVNLTLFDNALHGG